MFNFRTDSVQLLCHPRQVTNTEAEEFPNTLYFVVEGGEHKDMYNEEDNEHLADRYSLEIYLSETLDWDIGISIIFQ